MDNEFLKNLEAQEDFNQLDIITKLLVLLNEVKKLNEYNNNNILSAYTLLADKHNTLQRFVLGMQENMIRICDFLSEQERLNEAQSSTNSHVQETLYEFLTVLEKIENTLIDIANFS